MRLLLLVFGYFFVLTLIRRSKIREAEQFLRDIGGTQPDFMRPTDEMRRTLH